MGLQELRLRLKELDETILRAAAERIRLAREVAVVKAAEDLPTVDYVQERRVLERGREIARESSLEPELAEDLLVRLIEASVSEQEVQRLRYAGTGEGQRAVVVGGAGRMGRWMVRFLRAQSFQVEVVDPAAPAEIDAAGRRALPRADFILCATPPGTTAALYREWLSSPPAGLVCDISSIKSPLVEPIRKLQGAGVQVGSFHPMFGPDTVVLRNEDVAICNTGDPSAKEALEGLFAPTSARLVRVELEEHDRWMAEILALAHATTLAFAGALAGGPRPDLHSTTFRALEKLAASLAEESPEVYFEIQADNPYASEAVGHLVGALGRLERAVAERDRETFQALMEAASRATGAGPPSRA
jgi:chorismate mutase/prephenate dehydrogenase